MMKIGEREIGTHVPPFVVAEMSGNHNQSLERALAIVEAAANAGVDAVKLQTYTPDTMTLDIAEREFVITSANSPWKGLTLYELFRKAHTPWEWHEPIFKRCRELGVIGFSTPFDASAVDFLLELDVPAFKIASAEAVDLPLIRKAAAAGKPVIFSVQAPNNPIEEAHCGLTVPPRDPQALAEAVIKLYQMPIEEQEAMGQRGREYAKEHHDYAVLAEKLIACIEEVMAKQRRAV